MNDDDDDGICLIYYVSHVCNGGFLKTIELPLMHIWGYSP
jgi:hypothetical protein